MVGWYHLICWTPLSSKISLYPPPHHTRTHPPSKPDLLSPSTPFEVKACVLRLRVNVSHCYGVTGLHSRLFDPVLGLKSPFFFFFLNHHISWEVQTTDSICRVFCLSASFFLSFSLFILTLSLFVSLNLPSRFRSEAGALITIKRSVHSFTYCTQTRTYAFRHTLSLSISPPFSLPFYLNRIFLYLFFPYRLGLYISCLHLWCGNSKREHYWEVFKWQKL